MSCPTREGLESLTNYSAVLARLGRLPVNPQISGYYNVIRPDFGPNWQIRAQMQFMFPK